MCPFDLDLQGWRWRRAWGHFFSDLWEGEGSRDWEPRNLKTEGLAWESLLSLLQPKGFGANYSNSLGLSFLCVKWGHRSCIEGYYGDSEWGWWVSGTVFYYYCGCRGLESTLHHPATMFSHSVTGTRVFFSLSLLICVQRPKEMQEQELAV